MRYYYTYKVQCTAVGWEDYYYLGQHTTNNLDDGYKGSGKQLKEYYKQYPEDYTFTILAFYKDKTELSIAEQKLIGDLWKTDPYCLNCTSGGHGSWGHYSNIGKHHTDETKAKMSKAHKGKKMSNESKRKNSEKHKGKSLSEETKQKMSKTLKGHKGYMLGKFLSEEAKYKIGLATKARGCPTKGMHRVYREDGTYYMSKAE